MANPPPLLAYIHWPFCAALCPYCDFNVYADKGGKNSGRVGRGDWQAAYEANIAHQAKLAGLTERRDIESVFFGGGTPSLMPPKLLAAILASLDKHFGLAQAAEVSLEANPDGFTLAAAKDFKAAGVTRLSLGVQALDDAALKFLGRTHSAAQAQAAFEIAQSVFDKSSFDLIYARPDQSVAAWRAELRAALALQPCHISAYQLTLEKGTAFYRHFEKGRLVPPDEETQIALFDVTRDLCAAAGLRQYEISNFAKAGHECQHNMKSWHGADYLGLGAGAHGRLMAGDKKRYALVNEKNPQDWLAATKTKSGGLAVCEEMSAQARRDEAVLFGLRLADGVPLKNLETHGAALPRDKIAFLQKHGLLQNKKDVLAATPKGQYVLDALAGDLLG